MKRIRQGALAACIVASAFGLASCSDENPWSGSPGQGGISLRLTASPEYVDGVPSTRASESLFNVPDPSEFALKLEKLDGSFSKEWTSLDDFKNEKGFPAGAYTLTAIYGSLEYEGFDKPHFTGTEQFTVLEDRETQVEIEAALANTLVSVEYTEGFRSYFKSFSADIHSAGHSYVNIPETETRPVFVAPGEIDITIDFTDRQNRSAKLQAAAFEALARHHYHVTVDVNNGNIGSAQLVISFDDSVEAEDVYIDLTDELFTSPAPAITTEGFTDGQTFELLSGIPSGTPLKFHTTARAGISSAVLTIASESFTPSFGKEADLCNASPALQSQLGALGIDAIGFYKNPGDFGVVDLTSLPAALPAGTHTVTLAVKDKFNRISDPVSLTFVSEPVNLTVEALPSAFGTNEAVLNVTFNGGDPGDNLTFKAMNSNGMFVDAPVLKTVKGLGSRALAIDNWQITISLPETDRNPIPVKAYFKGEEVSDMSVPVIVPQFSAETDAFATKALIRITPEDPSMMQTIISSLTPVLTGGDGSALTFSRNAADGILTVNGLKPSTPYQLTLRLGSLSKDAGTFNTEADKELNGLSSTSRLEFDNIKTGGQYRVSPADYWNYSSISRDVPNDWATLNDLTCWNGSSEQNTWFMVPSTYIENGYAVIRSVGYHHSGTLPAKTGGAFNTKYYNEKAPDNLNRSAGELFLGEYTFSGGRVDGIPFASRPSSLSFDYRFAPYGSETALVEISVLDASGNVLASKSENLSGASDDLRKNLSLPDYPFGSKAAGLRVRFRSTAGEQIGLTIPTAAALKEPSVTNLLSSRTVPANEYKAVATGSVLSVKNVKLNY